MARRLSAWSAPTGGGRSAPRLRVGAEELGLGQDVSLHRSLERQLARPGGIDPFGDTLPSGIAARPGETLMIIATGIRRDEE
jgi:hypothetical protein